MTDSKDFVFDKRRFARVDINMEVDIYSMNKNLLGKGTAADLSASGIRIKTPVAATLRQGLEVFVTFKLPDGPQIERLRGEIKGIVKVTGNEEIRLRFTEFRALDLLREFVESKMKKNNP